MARYEYCPDCKKEVKLKEPPKFNILLFVLLMLTGIGGCLYMTYYVIVSSRSRCSVCGAKTVYSDF
jgi:hypothetical protein